MLLLLLSLLLASLLCRRFYPLVIYDCLLLWLHMLLLSLRVLWLWEGGRERLVVAVVVVVVVFVGFIVAVVRFELRQ